jgi:hypothetical protein
MTTVELGRVIVGATDLAAPPAPRVPIGKVVQGIQHGIAGLDAQVDVLLARKREVDRDVAESLRDGLVALATELEDAVDL